MKLTGAAYVTDTLSTAYRRPTEVGMYTGDAVRGSARETDVPCPFCREPLIEVTSRNAHRVVRVVARRQLQMRVIGQRVPRTHRILGCRACLVHFTALKPKSE